MIKYAQLDQCIKEIMRFNSIAHSEEERNSEEYRKLCQALVTEEDTETKEAQTLKDKLDGYCDVVVVAAQASECPNIDDDTKLAAYVKMCWAIHEACNEKYQGVPAFDFYGALMEVALNNNSKFPLLSEVKEMYGEDYQNAACDWIESQGRYTGVYCVERKDLEGNTRVVFKSKASSGKVLKWANYIDVDLSPYVVKTKEVKLTDEQFEEYTKRADQHGRVKLDKGEEV